MPFRRSNRRNSLVPIVSNKEVIDAVVLVAGAATTTDVNIAQAINDYTGSTGTCSTNAQIKGFLVEISYANTAGTIGRFDYYLCKQPGGAQGIGNYPVPGATGGSSFRSKIFHERKGLFTNPGTSIAGGQMSKSIEFLAIPKRFRKMNEDDNWFIRFNGSVSYSFCLKCIYKWYI